MLDERNIQNADELATTDLRRDALAIAEAGYAAIDVESAVARTIRIEGDDLIVGETRRPLSGRRVFFVGIGKCALTGAAAVERLLGERLTRGIALDVANPSGRTLSRIELIIGTHPLPSPENITATKRILSLLDECAEEDLVIMIISGGGSTLICAPEAPMTYADEVDIFKKLSAAGAAIQEMNTVRRHISTARGGGLARAAYPAEVLSLIVSDVPGNDIASISSGPTVYDGSTIADAQATLERYAITVPPRTTFLETPKDPAFFERVTNRLFLTNEDGLRAMRGAAHELGYAATIMTDALSGETHDAARNIVRTLHDAPPKTALLYAGETTVTLPAYSASGGRNQEMALAALPEVREGELLLAFASDGHDNTDAAGAIADETTRVHARERDLEPEAALARHTSYDFFTATGDALRVGYTGSNISDFIIALKY